MVKLQALKSFIKKKFPAVLLLHHKIIMGKAYVRYYSLIIFYRIRYPMTSVFNVIHNKRSWGKESSSGGGSDIKQTAIISEELPRLIQEMKVRSIIDAPCGDYNWMSKIPLNVDSYIGMDIVQELIRSNNDRYGSETEQFQCVDITRDNLPRVDLILCRDCLVHLSNDSVKNALQTFKQSGSKYLLTTTYPGATQKNWNIVSGMWRPIDLQKAPFSLPEPMQIINEHCTEGTDYKEKSLGLWRIEDIPT